MSSGQQWDKSCNLVSKDMTAQERMQSLSYVVQQTTSSCGVYLVTFCSTGFPLSVVIGGLEV